MPDESKWLPVVNRDYCTGCRLCVEACEHECLEMDVWEFAVLSRPRQCGSEGHCVNACPNDVIRMEWVPLSAEENEEQTGRWSREPLPPANGQPQKRFWRLFRSE